jgi:K+-sensing histidine kinase KdpD
VNENGEIVMVVEDDGKGIDGDALTHLFEPTSRAEHRRVGTGNWGLFTSRGIRVSPNDTATFAAATVLQTGIAFVACALSVRRAARLEPSAALRRD